MVASIKRAERGFTLTELMVGLAIIVIITAIAVPSFANQRKVNTDTQTRVALENTVSKVESALLRQPGAIVAVVKKPGGYMEITVGAFKENMNVKSTNLTIQANANTGNGSFSIAAWDTKGKKYVSANSALIFNSVNNNYSVGKFTR